MGSHEMYLEKKLHCVLLDVVSTTRKRIVILRIYSPCCLFADTAIFIVWLFGWSGGKGRVNAPTSNMIFQGLAHYVNVNNIYNTSVDGNNLSFNDAKSILYSLNDTTIPQAVSELWYIIITPLVKRHEAGVNILLEGN